MLPGLSNLEQRAERFRRAWRWIAALGAGLSLALALQAPALAQIGSISGQVIDAEVSETLSGVQVELQRGATVIQTATTDVNGGFTFTGVPDGRYSLLVSALGYETQRVDDIRVRGAATTVDDIALISRAFQLNPIVVTASRSQQQSLEAPASVFTIDQQEIAQAQPTTTADYVLAEPGVSGWRSGVQQHNIVTRGFNNVFSGALYILTDNRWASVPSLRLNAYSLIPVPNWGRGATGDRSARPTSSSTHRPKRRLWVKRRSSRAKRSPSAASVSRRARVSNTFSMASR